jgi:N-acetyl-anhydromuramyl-L-alanine amidase AmpD
MKPRGLVIHTVGVPGDASAASIRRFHKAPKPNGNGWKDIGYHYVIRKSGEVEWGRALHIAGAHLEGANDTLGVCMSGDGDSEAWTPAQREALFNLAVMKCREHAWTENEVVGHREGPARFGAKPTRKRCPGRLVDMAAVRAEVARRLAL